MMSHILWFIHGQMLLEQPYIGCRYKSFCNSTRLLHFCPTITSIFFCYYQTLKTIRWKKYEKISECPKIQFRGLGNRVVKNFQDIWIFARMSNFNQAKIGISWFQVFSSGFPKSWSKVGCDFPMVIWSQPRGAVKRRRTLGRRTPLY